MISKNLNADYINSGIKSLTLAESCQAFAVGGLVAFLVIAMGMIITAAIVFFFGAES